VVCREILALTKVNWNSCNFASVEPITLQFARTVGRVMRELPPDVPAARLYRFYMERRGAIRGQWIGHATGHISGILP
jgi:hypothetical protein